MKYKVNEVFYSLKGEGKWTGTPMAFVRLSGCNLNCEFCDTKDVCIGEFDEEELLRLVKNYPTGKVVITGGEPTIQPLYDLVNTLAFAGYSVHLETNGTNCLDAPFEFVTVSPKNLDCVGSTIVRANEIKFLCGTLGWEKFIDSFMKKYAHEIAIGTARLYLMPLAKAHAIGNRQYTDLIDENIHTAVQYCLDNPQFSLCMQIHKVVGIP